MNRINSCCSYMGGVFVLSNQVHAMSCGDGNIRVISDCVIECPRCKTRGHISWDTIGINHPPEELEGVFAVHDAEMIIKSRGG